jgi:hypothetical protein
MKTTTLPEWVIEALAALPPGEEMLVVIPVDGCVEVPGVYSREKWKRGEMPRHPLGAVGERVRVQHQSGGPHCQTIGWTHISLTAEPEVKRVGDLASGHEARAIAAAGLSIGGNMDTWAWFCRVRRV